jgi:hypothetical protein
MLVEVKKGKPRLCNDERFVNSLLPGIAFRMASLGRDIPAMVSEGDELATEDFSEAYYSCMMDEEVLPYMCFTWKGKYYTSRCMLFGFCLAPFFFTKLNRPIVVFLGALGITSLNYIDDWFWSKAREAMGEALGVAKRVLLSLRWQLNEKKSQRGNKVQLLGYEVWSDERKFTVPDTKVRVIAAKLARAITAWKSQEGFLKTDLQALAGHVLATSLAIPDVRVWKRSIYYQSLGAGPKVMISDYTGEEIEVLLFLLTELNGAPFFGGSHEVKLFVDTGEIGSSGPPRGVRKTGSKCDRPLVDLQGVDRPPFVFREAGNCRAHNREDRASHHG